MMKPLLANWVAGSLALAANGTAVAENAALEKTNIAISVGGSISQMNKVAYFVALNRKYFEQEGLTIDSTAFASGTAALQSLVAGGADVAEGAYEHTLRMQTKGVNLPVWWPMDAIQATFWWCGNRSPTRSRRSPTSKARRSASRRRILHA